MTSREVAAFLDREHEHAISWLRRLQSAGKVEYVWLKRISAPSLLQVQGTLELLVTTKGDGPADRNRSGIREIWVAS